MPARTLSDFVALLEREGELVRVRARVSPILEIAAIADHLSKCPAPHAPSPSARATDPRYHHLGGPAVLFENVEGSDIPILINAFGSYRRMELALGRPFQDIADQIAALVKPQPPRSLSELLAKARQFLPLLKIAPKRARPIHHDIILTGDQIDLTRLPLLRCWPLDGDLASVGWPDDINHNIPGVSHGPDWNTHHRGRYITLAGIHTIHADDRNSPKPPSHNIGMYRVQLLGPRTLAMHWHMHHDGASHWRSWKKLGQPMPVAIALGGEPCLPYAATAPLPPGISELLMAGFLNARGIALAPAKTIPLRIPANAEIIIEGFVSHEAGPIGFTPASPAAAAVAAASASASASSSSAAASASASSSQPEGLNVRSRGLSESSSETPGNAPQPLTHPERVQPTPTTPPLSTQHSALSTPHSALNTPPGPGAVIEGPFGDHTGFYSLPDRYPILTVTAVTMRARPIYPTTVVGLPPQEDYFLGKATERIMLPLLKTLIHDIEDYDLPMFGAFHNCAFIRIRKAYPLHARRVMHAIWGAGQMSWTKCIFIVDHDVDVHDHHAVLRAAARHCKPSRDLERVRGPLDILDHAAPYLGAGTKIGLDCTPKRDGEQAADPTSPLDPTPDDTQAHAEPFLSTLTATPGVLDARIPPEAPGWALVRTDITPDQTAPPGRGKRLLAALHERIADLPPAHIPPYLIAVGSDVDLHAPAALDTALFHWCANFDPGRDTHIAPIGSLPDHIAAIAMFDATPKSPRPGAFAGTNPATAHHEPVRPWPPILAYDQPTQDLIARRWDEYGLSAHQPAL